MEGTALADFGKRSKAMLLDSSIESATRIRTLLSKASTDMIEWAAVGTGWIAAWQKARPDIVIIDLHLPRRDGLYCVDKIMSLDGQSSVLFTHSYEGMMANHVELMALSLGAGSVLQRPFSDERFLLSVRRLLANTAKNKQLRKVKV